MDEGRGIPVAPVTEQRWIEAQHAERSFWMRLNGRNSYLRILRQFVYWSAKEPRLFLNQIRHGDFCYGEDWNYWWMKQFESYRALPKLAEKALEIGCGPYTNIRLISERCKIKEIHCSDPLIDVYTSFRLTWLSTQAKKGRIKTSDDRGECIRSADNNYDLVVCINVLDHVQNAEKCLREIIRVTKQGGFIAFGQDLSEVEDLTSRTVHDEPVHPILIHQKFIDSVLGDAYDCCLRKVLPRNRSRTQNKFGTYVLIGKKK